MKRRSVMICEVCRRWSADISKPCIPTRNRWRWSAASPESWTDIIAGNFFIVGLGESDFTDLPHELAERFAEQFRQPEIFMHVDDKIVAAPMPEEQTRGGMSY